MSVTELEDYQGLLRRIRMPGRDPGQVRADVDELAEALAAGTATQLINAGHRLTDVLCVVILRGGALLYPAFQSTLRHAAFRFVAVQRQRDGSASLDYQSELPRRRYDAVVYLDAVAATGRTLTTAAQADHYGDAAVYCAFLCASQQATGSLSMRGYHVVGFALHERLEGNLVSPDLGDLDAGDLMADAQRLRPASMLEARRP